MRQNVGHCYSIGRCIDDHVENAFSLLYFPVLFLVRRNTDFFALSESDTLRIMRLFALTYLYCIADAESSSPFPADLLGISLLSFSSDGGGVRCALLKPRRYLALFPFISRVISVPSSASHGRKLAIASLGDPAPSYFDHDGVKNGRVNYWPRDADF